MNAQHLLLTHLYNTELFYDDNERKLEFHYMLIATFSPYTYNMLHDIYDNHIYEIQQTNHTIQQRNINKEITLYRKYYKDLNVTKDTINNSIQNYNHIIKQNDYIKPELGYITSLPNGTLVVIKTTCWLKIFQRKIKNIIKNKNKNNKQ